MSAASASSEAADIGGGFGSAVNSNEKAMAVAFVDEAAAYVKDNGMQKALVEFNNRSGPFVHGEQYIFAYDFNGTNIAHPIRPDLVGHDQRGLLDINGVAVVENELSLARRGGGIMYLVFGNPAHDDAEELKLVVIKKLDDRLWIGSGAYLSDVSAAFSREERDQLVSFVEQARQFARNNSREKVLEVFNDPKGDFTRDGRYIFAYDYQGRILALPNQPELAGSDRIDARDPNGADFVRQAIDATRSGNGFLYYIYPDPSQNMTPALKLSYVVSVDDTWFLGSGIYAKGEE